MSIKDEHPCSNCQYFYGWQEVKIYVAGLCQETICVDIPICNRTIHILALNKCSKFKNIKGE